MLDIEFGRSVEPGPLLNGRVPRALLQANLNLTVGGVAWSGQVRRFLNGAEP